MKPKDEERTRCEVRTEGISAEQMALEFINKGILHIAENGSVWRLKKKMGGNQGPKLKTIRPVRADKELPNGYMQLQMYVDGVRTVCSVHRLVWFLAYGEIAKEMHVHHKNKNKADNRISNLDIIKSHNHVAMHNTDPGRHVWNRGLTVVNSEKAAKWHEKTVSARLANKQKEVMQSV